MRDSALLLTANLIGAGLGLIRAPVLTWLLPKAEVGMLGTVMAWLPFLQLLSLPGMDAASYHYIAKGQPWAYRVALGYRLQWSLLSLLAFMAGAAFWWSQDNVPLAWLFVAAGLLYPATTGLSAASGTLAASERFTALFRFRILEALVDFVGFVPLLLGVWLLTRAFTLYVTNQLALAALLITITLWLLRKQQLGRQPPPDPAERKAMLHYGRHQTALASIGVIQTRADALLVSAFFPLTVMADYSLALLAQSQLKNIWTIYISIRYPPLVRLSPRRRWRRMIWEGILVTIGFAGLGVLLAVAAAIVLPIILPPSYMSLLPYLNWLLVIFVLSIPGYLAEIYFRMEQDEMRQYRMRIAAATLGLLLPLLLLPSLDLQGIFLGRTAASILFSLLGVALFWRARLTVVTAGQASGDRDSAHLSP